MRYLRLHTPHGVHAWLPDDDANRRLVARLAASTGGWIEARTLTEQQLDQFLQAPTCTTGERTDWQ